MSRLAMYFVVMFTSNLVVAQAAQRPPVPGALAAAKEYNGQRSRRGAIVSQSLLKPIHATAAQRQRAVVPAALATPIFSSLNVYPSALGSQTVSAVADGDFNGDGVLDVALANFCSDSTCAQGSVTVFRGNGDGTFTEGDILKLGSHSIVAEYLGDNNYNAVNSVPMIQVVN